MSAQPAFPRSVSCPDAPALYAAPAISIKGLLVFSRLGFARLGLVSLVALSGLGSAWGYGKAGAASMHPPIAASHPQGAPRPAVSRLVDINSASRAELKTLPGIDDAAAARIVAARPYPSKAKLVAEQVISEQLFLSLRHQIVAIQKPAPMTKSSAKGSAKGSAQTDNKP